MFVNKCDFEGVGGYRPSVRSFCSVYFVEKSIHFFRFFTYVVFHIFSVFFDLKGTFQVQPLSGKGWWYVYNFDWYPKCPKWSALSRNVSISVVPVKYSILFIRAYL